MTQTSHELANFFVEASKALEELPHVKGKLSEVEESLDICRNVGYGKDEQISHLNGNISSLQAQIEALKAERDAAEYAAMEAKDEASKLIASIRDVMKGAAAADAILNPTPPMESAPISPVGEPNEAGSASSLAQPVLDSGSASAGQSPVGSDSSSETAPVTPEASDWDRPLSHAELALDSSSGTAQPQPVVAQENASGIASLRHDKPYDGEAYWLKPDSLSWQEWIAGGGEKAPYASDRY